MDTKIQEFTIRLAAAPISRRGFIGALFRTSATVAAAGFGLAGVPSQVAHGDGAKQIRATYGGVVVTPIVFDKANLRDHQDASIVGQRGVKPAYPTNQDGCACPGDGANPCTTCQYYSRSRLDGPFWTRCTYLPCCCNPCPDTCCTLGRAMTWEYYNWQYNCTEGVTRYAPVPTGNFGCDAIFTCAKGTCC